MKIAKTLEELDELTRERMAKIQWRKGTKVPEVWIQSFIVDTLYGEAWTEQKYAHLDKEQKRDFNRFFEATVNALAGQDYDQFLLKVDALLNEPTRQNMEHSKLILISNAIDKLTWDSNRFPSRGELVEESGYSHKAVNECLEQYRGSTLEKDRQEQLTLLREQMIAKCYQYGTRGDMKAARLFLEATEPKRRRETINTLEQKQRIKNQQNNFIQFNNLTITEEQINQLPEEKRQQMKDIITILVSKSRFKCK